MITKSITNVVHSAQGGVLQFNFMQGNMLKNMLAGDIMLNLFDTPRLDMAIANIFLRQLDDSGIVRVTHCCFTMTNSSPIRTRRMKSSGRPRLQTSLPL